jgi:hypothetical protein
MPLANRYLVCLVAVDVMLNIPPRSSMESLHLHQRSWTSVPSLQGCQRISSSELLAVFLFCDSLIDDRSVLTFLPSRPGCQPARFRPGSREEAITLLVAKRVKRAAGLTCPNANVAFCSPEKDSRSATMMDTKDIVGTHVEYAAALPPPG